MTIQSLWKDQPVGAPMDLAGVRARADRFRRTISRRNWVETAAGGLVGVGAPLMAFFSTDLPLISRIGVALAAPGIIFIVGVLWARGRAAMVPEPSASLMEHRQVLRNSLNSQAELLQRAWLWYVGPIVPTLVLFNAGLFMTNKASISALMVSLSVQLTVIAFVIVLNLKAAIRLRADVAMLDSGEISERPIAE